MAQKTLDDWMDEIDDLRAIADKYATLPPGPARNMLHMLSFGLGKMHAEMDRGSSERAKARRRRERRQAAQVPGQTPLEFDGA